jgi:hypothetical protein
MWRRSGKESEHGRRSLGPAREMIEDLFDHGRIFDGRDHLDRATAVLAGEDVDLGHPLQSLRLTLIETWRAGAGSSVLCDLRWLRRAAVACSRHRWFSAKTP